MAMVWCFLQVDFGCGKVLLNISLTSVSLEQCFYFYLMSQYLQFTSLEQCLHFILIQHPRHQDHAPTFVLKASERTNTKHVLYRLPGIKTSPGLVF